MKRELILVTTLIWGAPLYAETTESEAAPPALVQDVTPSEDDVQNTLRDLCTTYAKEEKTPSTEYTAYMSKCLASMTDLNEHANEPLPILDEEEQPTATPNSINANTPETSEGLVQNEIVTQPDPQAEQLDIK